MTEEIKNKLFNLMKEEDAKVKALETGEDRLNGNVKPYIGAIRERAGMWKVIEEFGLEIEYVKWANA